MDAEFRRRFLVGNSSRDSGVKIRSHAFIFILRRFSSVLVRWYRNCFASVTLTNVDTEKLE
jgi:hypothetical protein